jgi:hypothetical protein
LLVTGVIIINKVFMVAFETAMHQGTGDQMPIAPGGVGQENMG